MDEALNAIAKTGGSISDGLTMGDLMTRMGIPTSQQNRVTSMRLSEIMRSKGWVKQRQSSQGMRGYTWRKSENLS
jgi:hypothetical protein